MADFSKQWTPIVLLPEMSEDIRPVRALPEPPCFHLNGGEKASCFFAANTTVLRENFGGYLSKIFAICSIVYYNENTLTTVNVVIYADNT